MAVGAAIAAKDRPVLCLSADGSAMYTLQALWSMARESLKITTVIFANNSYNILKREFAGLRIGEPGPAASSLFDIGRPSIDWVSLAKGMGVPATRVDSLDSFARALQAGFDAGVPNLIELPISSHRFLRPGFGHPLFTKLLFHHFSQWESMAFRLR